MGRRPGNPPGPGSMHKGLSWPSGGAGRRTWPCRCRGRPQGPSMAGPSKRGGRSETSPGAMRCVEQVTFGPSRPRALGRGSLHGPEEWRLAVLAWERRGRLGGGHPQSLLRAGGHEPNAYCSYRRRPARGWWSRRWPGLGVRGLFGPERQPSRQGRSNCAARINPNRLPAVATRCSRRVRNSAVVQGHDPMDGPLHGFLWRGLTKDVGWFRPSRLHLRAVDDRERASRDHRSPELVQGNGGLDDQPHG